MKQIQVEETLWTVNRLFLEVFGIKPQTFRESILWAKKEQLLTHEEETALRVLIMHF